LSKIIFSFSVCAISDVIIVLAEVPNSPQSFKILLQNRALQSFISRNGQKLVTTTTPKILSIDEYRTFWISWKNGNIEVGYGQSPTLSSGLMQWRNGKTLQVSVGK